MSYYIISDYASSHQVVCYQYGMLYWTYLFFFAGFGTSAEMYYDITLQEAFFDAALEKYDVLILPTIPKKAPVFPKEKSPPMQGPIVIISSH